MITMWRMSAELDDEVTESCTQLLITLNFIANHSHEVREKLCMPDNT